MGKYSTGIDNYKEVRNNSIGEYDYGQMAHVKSLKEFFDKHQRKATKKDYQILRDLSTVRIKQFINGAA